jgi:Ca2+-binding RTX toxin-like protein
VVATAGNGAATVSFTPPASDGGTPITGYTVTASPGRKAASGALSPITVTALTNGVTYTFTVTATNGAGIGPASTASNTVTPTASGTTGGGTSGGGGSGGGGGGGSNSFILTVTPQTQTVVNGATASWTVSVTNTGGAYLYAVGVRDAVAPSCGIPSALTDTASFMAPGVTISYACSLPGVAASLTNTVVATATTGPGDLLTQTATGTVTVQAPPAPTPAPQTPRAPSTASRLHTISGSSRGDRLIGTAAADLINGLGGNDSINGGKGNDTLNGGPGHDTITGGPGHDTIFGGPGSDLINARDGTRDTIDCGPGRDIVTADKADKVGRNCELVHRA